MKRSRPPIYRGVAPCGYQGGGVGDYVCGGEDTSGRGTFEDDLVPRNGPLGAFGSGPLGVLAAACSSSIILLRNLLTSRRSCTADSSDII